jgi:hypothetical protein
MNKVEKLTDEQLIILFYKSENIDNELKKSIISEIDRRDLEKLVSTDKEVDFKEKITILFTSYFLFKKHLEKSSQLLKQGNKKGYRQYWRFFVYGIIFYTIILLLVAKYFIKPYFLK